MATLELVQADLADDVRWVQDQSTRRGASRKFWVEAGHRDPNKQIQLFTERYTTTPLANRPSAIWKGKRWYLKPGQALVAAPGTSDHEKDPASAVDVGCNAKDNPLRILLFKEANLTTPVPGEPWHVKRRAGSAVRLTKKEVQMVAEKTESPYINVPCPSGGFWRLQKSNGGVGALAGAPFFGSFGDVGAKVVSPLVGLTPCVRGGRVIGYWIFDQDGHLYSFGDAPYFTDYASHPEWHADNAVIDGLVQTGGLEAGRQIRYCFTRFELGDQEYIPDTYDIGREFVK